jgi:hypothetical protein
VNAIVKLTDPEILKARRECFEEARKDAALVLEAMACFKDWHAFYLAKDLLPCQSEMDRALWKYLEKYGDFEIAENEAQGIKFVDQVARAKE